MPKVTFTDLTVRSLPVGFHLDAKTPRFGLRVGKNTRTWVVLQGQKSDKKKLGQYPDLSLAEARRKALAAIGSPYLPSTAPTFPEALEQFLARNHWKPTSRYQINRILRGHFKWQKTVDKITHNDVAQVIDDIEAKSEAAHALKDIKAFFSWCVPRYIAHSPCEGIKTPYKYVPRNRLLSDAEIKRIWKAADKLGDYGLQVKRLIVCGQRCNQMFSLKEEWIDRKKRLIVFPAAFMKSNKDHTLPYGSLMESLLSTFPRITNQSKGKKPLDELCGVENFTLHDFRRYFSSTHARLKTPIEITENLLSHTSSGSRSEIQRIYDLYDRLPEMRQAVEKYDAWLKTLIDSP